MILNAVGLTRRWLSAAPRLTALGPVGTFREELPAVTCTAQASLLTGVHPNRHGVVANGWLFRDTNEVRFWQQSNRLLQAEPVYATAKRLAAERGRACKIAKLFWWFNQGAAVDLSVTPKPHYAVDGRKHFDVSATPPSLADDLKKRLGPFPFPAFWGPMSGLKSTAWIAASAAQVLREHRPDLTFVYLPHLDYEPQRRGPSGCDMAKLVGELDAACKPILDEAKALGARVWVVSEYGHGDVSQPIEVNRSLRLAGLLQVRPGPFGETLDLYGSQTFAVCDHQLAHVYMQNVEVPRVADVLRALPGVARVLVGDERSEIALDHPRSGEIVLLSEPHAWFAYPFWLHDGDAPDYARSVAIHHKPGFDPCELFFDPKLWAPKLRVARRLLQKTLGFRMTLDVVPLDASIVRGSHGLAAADDQDRPIWIGGTGLNAMTAFKNAVLAAMGLG